MIGNAIAGSKAPTATRAWVPSRTPLPVLTSSENFRRSRQTHALMLRAAGLKYRAICGRISRIRGVDVGPTTEQNMLAMCLAACRRNRVRMDIRGVTLSDYLFRKHGYGGRQYRP